MDRDEVMRVLRAFESAGLEKKGTVRSQDHVDAAALRARFNLKDEG